MPYYPIIPVPIPYPVCNQNQWYAPTIEGYIAPTSPSAILTVNQIN